MKSFNYPDRDLYDRTRPDSGLSQKDGDDDYVHVRIFELKLQYSAFEIYKQTLLLEKSKIEAELNAATIKNKEYEAQVSSLTSDLENLKEKTVDYQSERTRLLDELEGFKAKLSESDDLNNKLNKELDEMHGKINEYQIQIQEKDSTISRITEEHSIVNRENSEMTEEKNRLYFEKSELKRELERIKEQNTTMVQTLKRMDEVEEELKVLRLITSIDSPATDLYKVLNKYRSIDLRQLALNARMTQNKCLEFVQKLHEGGIIKIDGDLSANPTISLIG